MDHDSTPSHELFDIAISNIEKFFDFIGVTGKFDESLILIQHLVGLQEINYCSRNVNYRIDRNQKINSRTIHLINSRFKIDFKLYNMALEMMDSKINTVGEEFQFRLKQFQETKSENFEHKRAADYFYHNYDRLVEYMHYQIFTG